MGFSIQTGVSAATVFAQGALSFFSPCVLPLLPLYVSYLAGGAAEADGTGAIRYPRRRIFVNTLFFVLGISFAFFALGFGLSALGSFFRDAQVWFTRISGVIILLFGLYQLGLGRRSMALEQEHRLPLRLDKMAMNPLTALVLGFTFSFAWTPCVGPTLASVLLMAFSAASAAAGYLLIGVYTLGFVLPFLAVGLFTGEVLNFFKAHQKAVRYTVKIGAVLLIAMGVMTLTGFGSGAMASLGGNTSSAAGDSTPDSSAAASTPDGSTPDASTPDASTPAASAPDGSAAAEEEKVAAPDFTLLDQNGETRTLSDYQGKVVFLNFWATWCGPCRGELGDIQALYEAHGGNADDLVVLGVAGPNQGYEGSSQDIADFLTENGYDYPVVMDEDGSVFAQYGVRSFPTTFMIDAEGNVFGYVSGAISGETMEDIVAQTISGVRK